MQGEEESGQSAKPLREGIDFYREGPYVVFTERYLRERGYCCDSGCRHCPWKGEVGRGKGEE